MMNPPQGEDYRPLPGDLFPETYPFPYSEMYNYKYFWHKYYITQRSFFALAKRPQYVNYEVLSNAFATRVIDMSQADIYEIKNTEMKREDLERLVSANNLYSFEKFALRMMQMETLAGFEDSLLKKQEKQRVSEELIRDRQSKSFDDVVAPTQLKQTDN